MPSSSSARMTRTAISPRLATRTLLNMRRGMVLGRACRGADRPSRRLLRASRTGDRKSTRLNSSHANISYAVFCLKKKKKKKQQRFVYNFNYITYVYPYIAHYFSHYLFGD